MNLAIMYGQAWCWMELCDVISQRLSIKSVICGPAGVSQIRRLRVFCCSDAPNCLKTLFFSDFAQCTYYHIHISSYRLCPRVLPYGFSARPTMYLLASLPNLIFPVLRPVILKHWLLKIVFGDNVMQ